MALVTETPSARENKGAGEKSRNFSADADENSGAVMRADFTHCHSDPRILGLICPILCVQRFKPESDTDIKFNGEMRLTCV